ncbi:hypothetical protein CWI38_0004p0060 [Hamiltosporidium tvaerminnensis]|uniref:Uncharacterized protein n=1 Tax=Hamiltosporidium tvaerminnensis TaxID=1176355 RepID=A0A4Q9M2M6_9MICR|nr:hypothetical protein CWI38_0006p0070 [Hamiltosporidium tvaerminnensis]TBU20999.1 hypothetical protein CWI38_0004p0060 [Hamiltosporidium tvaerminnensis]
MILNATKAVRRFQINQKKNPILALLIFIMYKTHRNKLQEYFSKALDTLGIQFLAIKLNNIANFVKITYDSANKLFHTFCKQKTNLGSNVDDILREKMNNIVKNKKIEDLLDFCKIIQTFIRISFEFYLQIDNFKQEDAKNSVEKLISTVIDGMLLEHCKKENNFTQNHNKNDKFDPENINKDIALKFLKEKIIKNISPFKKDLINILKCFFMRFKFTTEEIFTDYNVIFAISDCLLRNAISSLEILQPIFQ